MQIPPGQQVCGTIQRAQSSFISARQLFLAVSFVEETEVAAQKDPVKKLPAPNYLGEGGNINWHNTLGGLLTHESAPLNPSSQKS